jgi:hypothetical protein
MKEPLICSKCNASAEYDRSTQVTTPTCTCKAPFYVDLIAVLKRPGKK